MLPKLLVLRGATDEQKWEFIRRKRNKIIRNVEWIHSVKASITLEQRNAGEVYIQALKDIPQMTNTPDEVVFPAPPDFLVDWIDL